MKKMNCFMWFAAAALPGVLLVAGCDEKKAAAPAAAETAVAAPAQMPAGAWEWMTDWKAAQERAKAENKPILIDFSGSDWCGWCIKLDQEVFSKAEFQKWAQDHVIPFLADFPRQSSQSEAEKMQNKALAEAYGIRGFPTVLLVRADGTVIARTGYQAGGPEKYIAHLEELLQ